MLRGSVGGRQYCPAIAAGTALPDADMYLTYKNRIRTLQIQKAAGNNQAGAFAGPVPFTRMQITAGRLCRRTRSPA